MLVPQLTDEAAIVLGYVRMVELRQHACLFKSYTCAAATCQTSVNNVAPLPRRASWVLTATEWHCWLAVCSLGA